MVDSILDQYSIEFADRLYLEASQKNCLMTGNFFEKQVTGDRFTVDSLGSYELKAVTGRNQDVEFDDVKHSRRWGYVNRNYAVIPIDGKDKLSTITDPQSGYIARALEAINREKDRTLVTASLADVLTGRNGTTTVTAANDGVQTVTASSGLTFDALTDTQQKLMSTGVNPFDPSTRIVLAITDVEHRKLISEEKLTSGDYNPNLYVENGMVRKALGMDVVVFPSAPKITAGVTGVPMLSVAGAVRSCFAFVGSTNYDSSLHLGYNGSGYQIRVEARPDKVDTYQIKVITDFGAVRSEGAKVVRINVTN